ncbi:MAG: hypothetical protein KF787_12340 [Phycisphaeraceae bacterium]|nr:hypothetical protein [Phycisphaeraceae bacterium]
MRITRSPAMTGVCAAVLAAVYMSIGSDSGRASAIKSWITGIGRAAATPAVDGILVVVRDGSAVAMGDWMPEAPWSEGDLWSEAAAGRAKVVRATYVRVQWRRGLFALTERVEARGVVFEPDLAGEDRVLATSAVIDLFDRSGDRRLGGAASELREFMGERAEVEWSGYALNALSGAAVLLGLLSAGWVTDIRSWVRASIRRRRVARGHCPGCGYPRAGLAENGIGRCPECGHGGTSRDLPLV